MTIEEFLQKWGHEDRFQENQPNSREKMKADLMALIQQSFEDGSRKLSPLSNTVGSTLAKEDRRCDP